MAYSVKAQSIAVVNSSRQELEAADHITSTIRSKQETSEPPPGFRHETRDITSTIRTRQHSSYLVSGQDSRHHINHREQKAVPDAVQVLVAYHVIQSRIPPKAMLPTACRYPHFS